MRTLHLLAAVAFAVTALAGCSTPTTPDTTVTDTPPAPAPLPALIAYNQTGCSEVIGILLVDPAVAQKGLPAGYSTRDAADLLGLPQPTGKAGVAFNLVRCNGGMAVTGEAFEGIFVNSPHLANVTLATADLDFYQMGYWNGNGTLRATLQQFGVPTGNLTATGNLQNLMVGTTGSAGVHDANATVHAFQFVVAGGMQDKALARFWTQTANGTAVFEYNVDQMAQQGSLGGCSFGAQSPVAMKLGITNCNGQGTAALYFPVQSWTGLIRLVPGVNAGQ